MRYRTLEHELKRRPFRPFRIVMDNGQSYAVRHPELLKASINDVYIFEPTAQDLAVPESVIAVCSTNSISAIEPLTESAT